MPLHALPLTRRSFLAQGAAAVVGVAAVRTGWCADARANPHLFALLSDTHIPESPETIASETNMTANLRQVVREITALEAQPAGVFVNGDCAHVKGLPGDYVNFVRCVTPLVDALLPLHLTLGNHDDRGPFYDALAPQRHAREVVESKHVSVVESPLANWFLLDSLKEVNVTAGKLGNVQRDWLAGALAARSDKPALVMVHHNPQFEPPAEGKAWGGIQDTAELFELLGRHSNVKALIFGHSHNWSISRRDKLHLINLPPVAYVFTAGKPNGWVRVELRERGISLELRTINPAHKQSGERVDLSWST